MPASSASTDAPRRHRPPPSSQPHRTAAPPPPQDADPTRVSALDSCAPATGHAPFTSRSPAGVSIVRMATTHPFVGRSLVGDIESEYDEFDRDADLEVSKRRDGWLEPSW